MLAHRMTLVRFRLCRKNLGNLREFLAKFIPLKPRERHLVSLKIQVTTHTQAHFSARDEN